ncbi:MAG: hypothetical protein WCA30_09810 [Dermatophilaceae bacterium]
MTAETLVLLLVVGARFGVPLLIPRFPLPGIIASLVLDAVDQTVFQSLGMDPPGYQGYDKAMDVYYLAIAYLSTLRNWTSRPARQVASFLYFYRLVGVVAFELTAWRPLLLLFPNTFEYFFIAYELVRLRWDPQRWGLRTWIGVAAVIWVVVKLPQEWWIHIAQLDVTEALAAHPWLWAAMLALVVGVVSALWWGVRPRLGRPDWTWQVAAPPLPPQVRTWRQRAEVAATGRVWSWVTAEKVALVGLISVVFAQVLPDVRSSDLQLFAGMGVVVVINVALSLAAARGGRGTDSALLAFGLRLLVNTALVVLADALLSDGKGSLNLAGAVFFLAMLSLLTLLDDRFRPVAIHRDATSTQTATSSQPAPPVQTATPHLTTTTENTP